MFLFDVCFDDILSLLVIQINPLPGSEAIINVEGSVNVITLLLGKVLFYLQYNCTVITFVLIQYTHLVRGSRHHSVIRKHDIIATVSTLVPTTSVIFWSSRRGDCALVPV